MTHRIERIGAEWRALVETARMLAVTWCESEEHAREWVAAMRRAWAHA